MLTERVCTSGSWVPKCIFGRAMASPGAQEAAARRMALQGVERRRTASNGVERHRTDLCRASLISDRPWLAPGSLLARSWLAPARSGSLQRALARFSLTLEHTMHFQKASQPHPKPHHLGVKIAGSFFHETGPHQTFPKSEPAAPKTAPSWCQKRRLVFPDTGPHQNRSKCEPNSAQPHRIWCRLAPSRKTSRGLAALRGSASCIWP